MADTVGKAQPHRPIADASSAVAKNPTKRRFRGAYAETSLRNMIEPLGFSRYSEAFHWERDLP